MGGAAKHMSHVWEVYDAKFSDVFNLLTDLTTGQIPVTEKFDGANIHFRVSNDGTIRFARNLTDIRNGGFSFEDALTLYQNHPAKDIFVEGCRAIDEAYTGSWWPFGYSGRDWINTEIIFIEQPQLLEYSHNAIVLHEVVTFLPDGSKTVDPVKHSNMSRLLEVDQSTTITNRDWKFLGPTFVELPSQSGEGYLTDAVERLKLCMSAAGLREDNTLRDFLRYSVRHGLVEQIRTSAAIKDRLADKISGVDPNVRLVDLKKGQPAGVAEKISYYGQRKHEPRHCREAMKPIINTLAAFSASRLAGLTSVLIECGDAESSRISELITSEGNRAAAATDDYAITRVNMFNDLLEQWNLVGSSPPAIEGITFEFAGRKVKITGGFADLNQLIGLNRYGRGDVPPLSSEPKSVPSLVEYFGMV
mgnify:CR=1 FL=1|tara:strand:- start:2766 stop:4019 length:1254 start_codon:yes stop_codon:yes gene_type:complete